MTKMAATGITEFAPGISQARQFALRHRWKPYVTPQELKDSIPLDVSIQNYDSAYHIISTNVKAIQQFSPEGAGSPRPANYLVELGEGLCGGAQRRGCFVTGFRGRGLFSGEPAPSGHELVHASVARGVRSLAPRDGP